MHPIRLKWRFVEVLILLVIVSLGALFVHVVGVRLDRGMQRLKTEAIHLLEAKIGRRISYQSISPSVFGFLGIRDLIVYSREDPRDILLRINRVTVYYDLIRFLTTRSAALSLSEIRIANSYFDINYEEDRELIEFLDSLRIGGGDGGRDLFAAGLNQPFTEQAYPRVDLSGTNISIRYSYADWQLEVSNLFFTVSNERDLYEVGVRGSVEARHTRSGSPVPGWLSARVKINGTLDRLFTWSDLALQIYSLSTDTIEVKRQTLQVTYESKDLKVRKIQDRAPLDVQVLYDSTSKDLSFQYKAEGFRPSDLFELTGPLERYNPYLSSLVTSSGSLTANLDRLDLSYTADLRIEMPDELLPFDVLVNSRLEGNEELITLEPFSISSTRGRAEFVGNIDLGNRLPSGTLRFDDFEPLSGRNLNATFEIERNRQGASISSGPLSVGKTRFEHFSLNLAPERDSIDFAMEAALRSNRDSSLAARGKIAWAPELSLSSQASLNGIPLSTIYALLVPPEEASPRLERDLGRYVVSTTADASTDFSGFNLATKELEILEAERPDNHLRLAAVASEDSLDLAEIRLRWNGYSLAGDVAVRRRQGRDELSSLLWLEDIPYQLDMELLPHRSLHISGSYGLEGSYQFSPMVTSGLLSGRVVQLRGNPFRLKSESLPIAFKKGTMFASVNVAGVVGPGGSLYATSSTASLRNIPLLMTKNNSLELGFAIADDAVIVDRATYRDDVSTLSGGGRVEIGGLLPIEASGSFHLQSDGDEESYSTEARIDGNRVQGSLEFTRAPLQRLAVSAVTGQLTGSVALEGNLPNPDLSVVLSLQEGRLNRDPLGLSLSAAYSQDAFILNSLNASFLSHRIENGTGRLDIDSGEFRFQSRYRAEVFQQIVNLRADLQGNIGGLPWPLTLDGVLENDLDGLVTLSDITVDRRDRPGWTVRLEGREGALAFDGGPGGSLDGTIARDGSFSLNLSDPLPIQGRASGRLTRSKLDSNFMVTALDMRMINTMTPKTDIFTFTTGRAQGSLRIFGSINDPDWVGYLDVTDAELEFAPSPDIVKPIAGRLLFDGKSFALPRITSYSGETRIEAEGTFYIDHWVPEAVELVFYAEEYPGIHIAYAFDPVYVDGYATGSVRVRSDAATTNLDGKILANSCRIALLRNQSESPASTTKPAVPLFVNMDIATGRSVEFFWPAMNFPIVRTFARQGQQVSLHVNEDTGEFSMEGEVEIRGGEIFYFDRSFYLKQGSITFAERPDEFDPWIYALAEIRERDINNEEVTIYLEANNKLSLFSPRFYSEPSRSDAEVLNLIGGTILNRFEDTDFGTAAVMLTSDIISQFGILTPFERAVRDVLKLDMFTVRTQFLQNVLIGRIRGENLVENSFNPLDNTTLTLGKYLGTDLFLEALVRFQNENDFATTNRIRTEGELNLEWVTPFFLLEWTFTPTHPENLFLSDNSIGLSWKYSY